MVNFIDTIKMTTAKIEDDYLQFQNSGTNYGRLTGTADGNVTWTSNAGNVRMSGIDTPTGPTDAVNKQYVDYSLTKVDYATTQSVTVATVDEIDNSTLATGDIVLVKNQDLTIDSGDFSTTTNGTSSTWLFGAYNSNGANGTFIKCIETGATSNQVAYSTDNGSTWTNVSLSSDNIDIDSNQSIVVAKDTFIIGVSGIGTFNRIYTSTDGITWNGYRSSFGITVTGLAYSEPLDVVIGYFTNLEYSTNLGQTWTACTVNGGSLSSVKSVWAFDKFYIFDSDEMWTSVDGITFNLSPINPPATFLDVAWSPQLKIMIAIQNTNDLVYVSTDGITFITYTPTLSLQAIKWVDDYGIFVGMGEDATAGGTGPTLFYSYDGINWSSTSTNATSNGLIFFDVIYGNGRIISPGYVSNEHIVGVLENSEDGIYEYDGSGLVRSSGWPLGTSYEGFQVLVEKGATNANTKWVSSMLSGASVGNKVLLNEIEYQNVTSNAESIIVDNNDITFLTTTAGDVRLASADNIELIDGGVTFTKNGSTLTSSTDMTLQSASGQDATLQAQGAGNVVLNNAGSGNIELVDNSVTFTKSGNTMSSSGAITLQSASNTNATLQSQGTGSVILNANGDTYTLDGGVMTSSGLMTLTSASNTNATLQSQGTGNVVLNAAGTGIVTTDDVVTLTNTTASTNATSGSFQVTGGVGIDDDINVSGGYNKTAIATVRPLTFDTESVSSNQSESIYKVIWVSDLGLYLYAAEDTIYYSSDGTTLTSVATTSFYGRGVAWSPELRLAVAVGTNNSGGATTTSYTSPDGINWTQQTVPSHEWNQVVWGSGLFVATTGVTSNSTSVLYSSDGINWTEGTILGGAIYNCCAFSPELNRYVILGNNGGIQMRAYYSNDGINWITATQNASLANDTEDVAWGSGYNGTTGLFMAIGFGSADATDSISSTDGIIWNNVGNINFNSWKSITWSKSLDMFFATINANLVAYYTGGSWTTSSIATNKNFTSVTWSPEQNAFVVCSANTTTSVSLKLTGDFSTLTPNVEMGTQGASTITIQGANVDLGKNSTNITLGEGGEEITIGDQSSITAVVGKLNVNTQNSVSKGTITQPMVFTERTEPVAGLDWNASVWSTVDSQFVMVGNGGSNTQRTIYSSDGITWSQGTAINVNYSWSGLATDDTYGIYLACALTTSGSSDWMYSTNGTTTWTAHNTGNSTFWQDVAWTGELFAGNSGYTTFAPIGRKISSPFNSIYAQAVGFNKSASATLQATANSSTGDRRNIYGIAYAPESEISITTANGVGRAVYVGTNVAGYNDGVATGASFGSPAWTNSTTVPTGDWKKVAWSPTLQLFCACGTNFNACIMTTPDGVTWTNKDLGWQYANPEFFGITWVSTYDCFFVTGTNNRHFYTFDTNTWYPVTIDSAGTQDMVTTAFSPTLNSNVGRLIVAGLTDPEIYSAEMDNMIQIAPNQASVRGSNTINIGSIYDNITIGQYDAPRILAYCTVFCFDTTIFDIQDSQNVSTVSQLATGSYLVTFIDEIPTVKAVGVAMTFRTDSGTGYDAYVTRLHSNEARVSVQSSTTALSNNIGFRMFILGGSYNNGMVIYDQGF